MSAPPTEARERVDLELVLAVDASSSIDDREFDLQMRGLAEAFKHPGVQGAIQAAGDHGIAVSMVQWSDSNAQVVAIDWHYLGNPAAAEEFSELIAGTPRFIIGGGTAIGSVIEFAIKFIRENQFDGRRRVIDISGDGRANQGAIPSRRRDRAVAQGIVINGLAILNEDPAVDDHYLYNVIGGTGAFVIRAQDFEDFAKAIVRKLIKEISGTPIASRPAGADPGQSRYGPQISLSFEPRFATTRSRAR